jgi:L-aminopeptidase/D-esterase-like protein
VQKSESTSHHMTTNSNLITDVPGILVGSVHDAYYGE